MNPQNKPMTAEEYIKLAKKVNRLNNINHWIAELRRIALSSNLKDEDGYPLPVWEIRQIFCINSFRQQFNDGDTPQEAFINCLQSWRDDM